MRMLPDGVSCYAKSPEFTEQTIPPNLQRSHRTEANTWGKIVVLEGRLRYRVLEPEVRETELSCEKPGIIKPQIAHEVEALGKVRFYVEFYR